MRRVLIFGGRGHVGSYAVEAMRQNGFLVHTAGRSSLNDLAADLTLGPDPAEVVLRKLRPDVVINCVGSIWGKSSASMDVEVRQTTSHLISAIGATMPGQVKYVHVGSLLEYGPLTKPATTSTKEHPNTTYGTARLHATRDVLRAHRAGLLEATILRLANVIGPGAPDVSVCGRIAVQLSNAQADDPTITLRKTSDRRDYIDVRDVADCIVRAVKVPSPQHPVPIGTGKPCGAADLFSDLAAVSGLAARLLFTDEAPAAHSQNALLTVDPADGQKHFSFTADVSRQHSLADYWTAYLNSGNKERE